MKLCTNKIKNGIPNAIYGVNLEVSLGKLSELNVSGEHEDHDWDGKWLQKGDLPALGGKWRKTEGYTRISDRDDSAVGWKTNLGSIFSLSLDNSDKQERYSISFGAQSHTPIIEKSTPKPPANNPTSFSVARNMYSHHNDNK